MATQTHNEANDMGDSHLISTPAYFRSDNGYITPISILTDGANMYDAHGLDMTGTGEELDMSGWPHERVEVYHSEAGMEILVPVN